MTTQPETSLGENQTPEQQIPATEAPSVFQRPTAGTPQMPEGGLKAWISGLRPTRRGMFIYGRFDLQGEIDHAADMEMRTKGDEAKKWKERAEELTDELMASRVWFEFEGRSQEWVTAFIKKLNKQGIPEGAEQLKRQMLQQLTQPEGITLDDLDAIQEYTPAQFMKLMDKLVEAQTMTPVVNPRFLRSSSDD